MSVPLPEDEHVRYTADSRRQGVHGRTIAREIAEGRIVRIRHGATVDADLWQGLSFERQHRLRVLASARFTGHHIYSNASAAVLHRLPLVGATRHDVEVFDPSRRSGRTNHTITPRAGSFASPELAEVDGLSVTSVSATLIDLAHAMSLETSLCAMEFALRAGRDLCRRDELVRALSVTNRQRGANRARFVVMFASDLSDSPLESISRLRMWQLRFPKPVQQQPFVDRAGRTRLVDFWWPEQKVIGEADGDVKYTAAKYTSGRTAGQVVLDEKHREDDLRSQAASFGRWDWKGAWFSMGMTAELRRCGLRPQRSPWHIPGYSP